MSEELVILNNELQLLFPICDEIGVIAQLEGVIGSECFDIEINLFEVTYIFDGFVVEIDYENCKLTKLIIHDETQPGKIIKYGEVYTNE